MTASMVAMPVAMLEGDQVKRFKETQTATPGCVAPHRI